MSNKEKTAMGQGKNTARPIPRLRFPDFLNAGEWSSPKLADISTPVEERVGERTLTPVSISAGIGFVPQAEKFGRDISGNQYRLYTVVRDGDFVYNKGNSLRFPQGCVYDLQGWGEVAAPSVFISFRLKEGYEIGFFRQCFEHNIHGIQLKKEITSGARSNGLLNISKEAFFDIRIPTPSQEEQRHIGECLSSLDSAIAAESKKLEALKLHKDGLIQGLFPSGGSVSPELRLPEFEGDGAWPKTPAGNIFLNRTERGKSGLPIYSVTMTDGMVPRASLDRKIEDIAVAGINKTARTGDIAYNMMRMWQGALGVAPVNCMVSPAYIVLEPRGVNPFFYLYLLKQPQFLQILTAHSRGLTEDRLRLYYDDFAKIPLPCPTLAEQRRIADCLLSVDQLIAAQTSKISVIKTQKKGLMQRLFPVVTPVGV